MSGQASTTVAVVGAIGAGAAGGPLAEVFNELALVLALMGAAGGMTRGIANRLPWREVGRGTFLGALIAFGMGALSPSIVESLFQINPGTTIPVLAASSFLIGFGQDVVIAFLKRGAK